VHRTAEEQAEEDNFLSLYGAWSALSPAQVARELADFSRPWWVVGGWAIEAATGYRREHDDTDISILACDVPEFVACLASRWHVWHNDSGVFQPLGRRRTTVENPESQLWLRKNAASPWVLDVPLTPDRDGMWTNRRLPEHVAPVDDVTWKGSDGIRYLQPEIVLMYKARLRRPKDKLDLETTLPLLSDDRRRWLRETLASFDPGNPWLDRI